MGIELIELDIEPFKEILPEGIPRNSFILLTGSGGSSKSVLAMTMVKYFLEKKLPVVYLALDDDPKSIVTRLKLFDIDVIEYVKNNLFMIIDGYSFRIRDKKEKMHMSVVEEIDPQNIDQVLYTLMRVIDEKQLGNRAFLVIDSINEFLSHYEPHRVAEFLKSVRANITKNRNILTLAILHTSTQMLREFQLSLEYIVDGLIITEIVVQPSSRESMPISLRQLIVKKMKGVRHRIDSVLYIVDKKGIRLYTQ